MFIVQYCACRLWSCPLPRHLTKHQALDMPQGMRLNCAVTWQQVKLVKPEVEKASYDAADARVDRRAFMQQQGHS